MKRTTKARRPRKLKAAVRAAPPPRYVEVGQATVGLPDALVTLLASYRVITAPTKRVEASITVTVDALEPTPNGGPNLRTHGVSITVAKRAFPFGTQPSAKFPPVPQDLAEVAAGNWLFERFTCAFQTRGQQ